MAERDGDPTEQATPHKLREARKKGNVAKSQDFSAAVILATAAMLVHGGVADRLRELAQLQRGVIARASQDSWTVDAVAAWLGKLLAASAGLLAPSLLMIVIAAICVNLAQSGVIFSGEPLKPDFQRINPATGFKRIWSMRTLYETFKSIVKVVLLALVTWSLLKGMLPGLAGLSGADPRSYLGIAARLAGGLMTKLAALLFAIGLADLLYVRWEYTKRMRMSTREVKDEAKNRDGDPRLRARRRELQREVLQRSAAVQKVQGADVLLTNPTHLAVAISYRHGSGGAPQVVAKGAGEVAQNMKLVAARHRVPIVENRPLARALFREVRQEDYVPEKFYPQVARIMVWVYSLRDAQRRSARK